MYSRPQKKSLSDQIDDVVIEFKIVAKAYLVDWFIMHVPRLTGALLNDMVHVLMSFDEISIGSDLDYGFIVNAMNPPITWTWPSTVYHFMDEAFSYLQVNSINWFDIARRRLDNYT